MFFVHNEDSLKWVSRSDGVVYAIRSLPIVMKEAFSFTCCCDNNCDDSGDVLVRYSFYDRQPQGKYCLVVLKSYNYVCQLVSAL